MRYPLRFILYALICITGHSGILKAEENLPDSIITIGHTYEYCLTQPAKSQRIIDELRAQNSEEEWKLDWCQADLYYNTGQYKLANYYFEKVAGNNIVNADPDLYIGLLSSMIESYMMNNDTKNALDSSMKLLELAKEAGNDAEIGRAYMFIGNALFYQKSYVIAAEYHDKADRHFERSKNNPYLFHFNMTLANMLTEIGEYERAIEKALRSESILKELSLMNDMPESYYEYEKARLFSLVGYIYAKLGDKKKADRYYAEFKRSFANDEVRTKIHIVPYLLAIESYDEALDISLERQNSLRMHTDTIGNDMVTAKLYIADIYSKTGDYPNAFAYSRQIVAMKDSIRQRERENETAQLAAMLYVTEQKAELEAQNSRIFTQRVLLISAAIIVALLMTLSVIIERLLIRTRKKNRDIVGHIRQLRHYKNLYYSLLRKKGEQSREGEADSGNFDLDERKTYELLCNVMEKDKLYLNPAITRDNIISILSVRRNVFIKAIKDCFGGTFTDFMNNLRLDEAIRLMDTGDNGDLTLEVISEQSGFGSVRSFYRQFKVKYGMSPNEYRKYNQEITEIDLPIQDPE